MAIQVSIEKHHLFVFLLLFAFVLGSVFVVAFGGTNPAVLGHTVGELQGTTCPGTQKLTVNASGGLECAADVDTNTQCDDQNCGTIDVDGLQNSDSTSIAINSDNLALGLAGGGLSREILVSNGGRDFSIRVDNSVNNGNLIFRDSTGGTDKVRIQEGAGAVDVFTSLTVSSTATINGGGNTVSRCTVAGTLPVGTLTVVPGGGNCGASAVTGLVVS